MSNFFKQEDIDRVREAVDIVDYINEITPLKRKGARFWGLCPFHKEKTPSFSVDPTLQLYHCFGCGEGGNLFTFLMKHDKLEFPEAVVHLADRTGYRLEPITGQKGDQIRSRTSQLQEVNTKAAVFFHRMLVEDDKARAAREYLTSRGINERTIELFKLGYAPQDPKKPALLSEQLIASGIALDDLVELGLTIRTERGLLDRFRDRIMFPIFDAKGKVIAFGGRVMGEQQPKYLNSPESRLFKKGSVFYGFSHNKNDIIKEHFAIVTEGYTDVLMMHQSGVKNAVATLGTALTQDHIQFLKRYTERAYLVFDSDAAGLNAAMRCLNYLDDFLMPGYQQIRDLVGKFLDIRVTVLPEGADPASMAQELGKGFAQAFLDTLSRSAGVIDFALTQIASAYDLNDTSQKLKASEEIKGLLRRLPGAVAQEEYAKKAAELLGVSHESLRRELVSRSRTRPGQPVQAQSEPNSLENRTQGELLVLLFTQFELLRGRPEILEELSDEYLSDPLTLEVLRAFRSCLTEPGISVRTFVSGLGREKGEEIAKILMSSDASTGLSAEEAEEHVRGLIKRLKRSHLEYRIKQLKEDYAKTKQKHALSLSTSEPIQQGSEHTDMRSKMDALFAELVRLETEKKQLR